MAGTPSPNATLSILGFIRQNSLTTLHICPVHSKSHTLHAVIQLTAQRKQNPKSSRPLLSGYNFTMVHKDLPNRLYSHAIF